jgi:hypothetical protein
MDPEHDATTISSSAEPSIEQQLPAAQWAAQPFHHQPLDHSQESLRLLKVLPNLSTDGKIQCSLQHTTIKEASYTCLSYMWGEDAGAHDILMNACTYSIGQNLFDFLDVFRQTQSSPEYIWIDALCIDQRNFKERNHQVEQMGTIFSLASLVYVWLGLWPRELDCMLSWQALDPDGRNSPLDGLTAWYIMFNEYWNRAWIMQEVILAREVILVLDRKRLYLSGLLSTLKVSGLEGVPFAESPLYQYVSVRNGSLTVQDEDIISLLDRFRFRRCSLLKDRVFSLLSLCSISSRIPVDYEVSTMDLARTVVSRRGESLCLCDIILVLHSLHPSRQDYIDGDERLEMNSPPLWGDAHVEIDMLGFQTTLWEGQSGIQRALLELNGCRICPAIRQIVESGVTDLLATTAISEMHDTGHTQLPWLLRGMDGKVQARSKSMTIKKSQSDPRAYTIRYPVSYLAEEFPLSTALCPVFARPKAGLRDSTYTKYKAVWDEHFVAETKNGVSPLAKFEQCFVEYVYRRDRIGLAQPDWLRLSEFKQHLVSGEHEACKTHHSDIPHTILDPNVEERFEWGPCRLDV